MKIGGNSDKGGKDRLGEERNCTNWLTQTPETAPGTSKVRFGAAQEAPRIIDGMAAVVLSGARGLPNKYLKILRY